jgi:hypothetical protein
MTTTSATSPFPGCGCPACLHNLPTRPVPAPARSAGWFDERKALIFLLGQLKSAIARKDGDAVVTIFKTIGWVAGDDYALDLMQQLINAATQRLRGDRQ